MAKFYGMDKINFPSERKANEFIEKYESEILINRGYAPVRAYFNDCSQTWQVTSRYTVDDSYYGEIITTFQRETGKRLPYPHTDQQFRKHRDDALLYYMDSKICFVAKSLCEDMEDDSLSTIINEIRVAHSLCDYKKEGWNESHKGKVAKFISKWSKWNAGQISDKACRDHMKKALDYFERKTLSFKKKGSAAREESPAEIRELNYCVKQMAGFQHYYDMGETEMAKIHLMKAYKAFESISPDTQHSYPRKKVKCLLFEGFELLLQNKESA